jgi:hypothetical protein
VIFDEYWVNGQFMANLLPTWTRPLALMVMLMAVGATWAIGAAAAAADGSLTAAAEGATATASTASEEVPAPAVEEEPAATPATAEAPSPSTSEVAAAVEEPQSGSGTDTGAAVADEPSEAVSGALKETGEAPVETGEAPVAATAEHATSTRQAADRSPAGVGRPVSQVADMTRQVSSEAAGVTEVAEAPLRPISGIATQVDGALGSPIDRVISTDQLDQPVGVLQSVVPLARPVLSPVEDLLATPVVDDLPATQTVRELIARIPKLVLPIPHGFFGSPLPDVSSGDAPTRPRPAFAGEEDKAPQPGAAPREGLGSFDLDASRLPFAQTPSPNPGDALLPGSTPGLNVGTGADRGSPTPTPSPPDGPRDAPGSFGAGPSGGSFSPPIAALLALLALVVPAIRRRPWEVPTLPAPTPFACALERPG